MSVLTVILYVIVVVVALLLIGLILIQQSKGGGFGTSFGGIGESVFGAHASSHLTKLTVIMTTLFFILTLVLAVIVGRRGTEQGIAEKVVELEQNSSQPAVVGLPSTRPPVDLPEAVPSEIDTQNAETQSRDLE